MNVNITFTPVGESGADTGLTFSVIDRSAPVRLQGDRFPVGVTNVTQGGKVFSQIFDQYAQYEIEWRNLSPLPDSTTDIDNFWHRFKVFQSHTQRGGEFALAIDSANDDATLTNGATARAATTLTVDSISGFSDGDWLYVEDADDPTKWSEVPIEGTPSGSSLPIRRLEISLADNSVVRHRDYYPSCIIDPPWESNFNFRQRPAGRGNYYDLAFTFRTVR